LLQVPPMVVERFKHRQMGGDDVFDEFFLEAPP
jgi:hypothetical protein